MLEPAELASFYFWLLYWQELTHQAWAVQTLYIAKNSLSSGLALGQLLGDELGALRIFCLLVLLSSWDLRPCGASASFIRQFMLTILLIVYTCFCMLRLCAMQCQFDWIVCTNNVINGELLFSLLGIYIWVSDVTHKIVTCLHDSSPKDPPKTAKYEGLDWSSLAESTMQTLSLSILGK